MISASCDRLQDCNRRPLAAEPRAHRKSSGVAKFELGTFLLLIVSFFALAFLSLSVPALQSWRPLKYKCEAPIIGGLETEPPAGSRGKAPAGSGAEERSPSEAETFLAFGRSLKVANLATLKIFKTQKFRYNLCCCF